MRSGHRRLRFSSGDHHIEREEGVSSDGRHSRLQDELTELVPMAPVSVPATSPILRQPSTSAAIRRLHTDLMIRSTPCSPRRPTVSRTDMVDRNGDRVDYRPTAYVQHLFTQPTNQMTAAGNSTVLLDRHNGQHTSTLNLQHSDRTFESDWLDVVLCECDGGAASDGLGVLNVLRNDRSVYSTARDRNVNIILKHTSRLTSQQAVPFSLSEVCIRVPCDGFTAPLKNGFIFVCSENVLPSEFESYDHVNTTSLLCTTGRTSEIKLPQVPPSVRTVLYFNLDPNAVCFRYKFQSAVTDARYLFVKLLGSVGRGENIDVQFLGFKGSLGKLSFPCASIN